MKLLIIIVNVFLLNYLILDQVRPLFLNFLGEYIIFLWNDVTQKLYEIQNSQEKFRSWILNDRIKSG